MKSDIRVAAPPPGRCWFSTAIAISARSGCAAGGTDDRRRRGLSAVAGCQHCRAVPGNLALSGLQRAVQLIEPDGAVYSGAEAVFPATAGKESKVAVAVERLRKDSCPRANHGRRLQFCRRSQDFFLPAHALVLGPARRTAGLFSDALDFSACARCDLSRRFRFALDANQRPHRPQRYFASRPVHVRRPAAV